ncbi:DUF308 domain-containing protein [Halosquirtibacter laminarini]|uniref:DUF308 domain-containing protein n=1 Tax=Halosquirtibacter laminarini TaxID=3374600 RepID=A0AC61NMA9_9BACT|nr:DUF308 domain-containing protein [Prolixibacteraceae bacterium]
MKHFHFIQHKRNLIRGILGVLLGAVMLFVPGITAKVILILIGSLFLVIGLSGLLFNTKKISLPFRNLLRTESYISVLIGLVLVVFPIQLTEILSFIVGLGLLLLCIRQGLNYFQTMQYFNPSKLYLISAIVELIIAVILLFFPKLLVSIIVWVVGCILVLYGANQIGLYIQMKRKYNGASSKDIEDVDFKEL